MSSQFQVNSRIRVSLVVLAGLLVGVAVPAKAQSYLQNVGVPPFTTKQPVENGFINVANGNLHLEIPLAPFRNAAAHPKESS